MGSTTSARRRLSAPIELGQARHADLSGRHRLARPAGDLMISMCRRRPRCSRMRRFRSRFAARRPICRPQDFTVEMQIRRQADRAGASPRHRPQGEGRNVHAAVPGEDGRGGHARGHRSRRRANRGTRSRWPTITATRIIRVGRGQGEGAARRWRSPLGVSLSGDGAAARSGDCAGAGRLFAAAHRHGQGGSARQGGAGEDEVAADVEGDAIRCWISIASCSATWRRRSCRWPIAGGWSGTSASEAAR